MVRKEQRQILDESRLLSATQFLRDYFGEIPVTSIILGSGLAAFADTLTDAKSIPTRQIPHYPVSTVEGHPGRWVVGKCHAIPVLALQGRIHGYEGYSQDQIGFPIHLLAELGVRHLIVTNAAGGINRFYVPGQFMVIVDHINLTFDNPLWGRNLHKYGPRFPDMYSAYDPEFIEIAMEEGR
ncbi:MAG: purine-nucleoside phosphorylase, partial [Calditrichaeota bacterium]